MGEEGENRGYEGKFDLNIVPFNPPVDVDEAAAAWKKWIKGFCRKILFFRVKEVDDRAIAFVMYGGETVDDLVDTLPNPVDGDVKFPVEWGILKMKPDGTADEAINNFHKAVFKVNKHFSTRANKDTARSQFESMKQGDLKMANYYVDLRKQAEKCQFADKDDSIRTRILQTMTDKKLRREAMYKNYTLAQIVDNATNKEDIERQAKEMEQGSAVVHKVYQQKQKSRPGQKSKWKKHGKQQNEQQQQSQKDQGDDKKSDKKECSYCGYSHAGPRTKCPASGKTCHNCNGKGHFQKQCKAPRKGRTHHVNEGAAGGESSDSDDGFVFSVQDGAKRPTVKVTISGVRGHADADSCSSANVMDEKQFDAIAANSEKPLKLKPASNKLYPYAQHQPLELAGKFTATIRSLVTQQEVITEFLVVKGSANSRPLLSFDTSVALGVLQVTNANLKRPPMETTGYESIKEEFQEVFTGLGKHRRISASFIVDESIHPMVLKQHKVPYHLDKQVRIEEDRLIALGVLEEVPDDEATTWCTNPVIAPKPHKPGAIRYCSNMRVPNTAIKRPITEALTVEDVKVRLANATCFSILDMNEAYHQLVLEKASRHMTTFYGTRGRLRYARLNYGTISAQDIFDKAMDDTIHGLKGVLHIRDDFVIHGESKDDHDAALRAFLSRFKDSGLTLSPKKCKIGVPEIEFFGLTFSKRGVSPAPSKVEALRNMGKPTDAAEVRSLLGMAQYSSQFIPNFSDLTAPLRELTKSGSSWKWEEEEEGAFKKLQSCLSRDTVLGYYQVSQKTRLMVDAGPNGLGLIMFQLKEKGWQPVVCASRSLTDVEKRYSQMEKEALAIRWACERCYIYLIGSPRFTIITDHQPLIPLFNNPNSKPPLRLERWLMYLQQFDFVLEYSPGKTNGADYLSRHSLPLTSEDTHTSAYRDAVVKSVIHPQGYHHSRIAGSHS